MHLITPFCYGVYALMLETQCHFLTNMIEKIEIHSPPLSNLTTMIFLSNFVPTLYMLMDQWVVHDLSRT